MSKFTVIVADPPWAFSDKLRMSDVARGAQANYSTMTISDIQALPVKDVCDPEGAVLCLWVPGSLLKEGLATLEAWGFKHKQTYVWVKTRKIENLKREIFKSAKNLVEELKNKVPKVKVLTNLTLNLGSMLGFGMGRLFRQTHEICLVGTSNNKVYKKLANKSRRSVCLAPNLKHSSKPDDLQDSLEIMFPKTKKLEMFARRVKLGWTCLGNEIDGKDIRIALSEL